MPSALTSTVHALVRSELTTLVAALREEIAAGGGWHATASGVADVLRSHRPSLDLLTAAERQGTAERPTGHCLHVEPDGSFSLLAVVWRQGQWTSIHNHVTWCVFTGVQGEVVEELYHLDASSQALALAGHSRCKVGTVRCEVPPGDIHRAGNPHSDTAITLHVYGTDIERLGSSVRRTYDLPDVSGVSGRAAA